MFLVVDRVFVGLCDTNRFLIVSPGSMVSIVFNDYIEMSSTYLYLVYRILYTPLYPTSFYMFSSFRISLMYPESSYKSVYEAAATFCVDRISKFCFFKRKTLKTAFASKRKP